MKKNRLLAYLLFATVAGYWIAQAGSLEPPAALGPTMQPLDALDTKMDGIPSSWYKVINDPLRFKIVMNGEAALDTETGLVWERVPDGLERDWYLSITHCMERIVDNRMGWRLPAAEELFSLLDRSQSMPALPENHPFTLPPGGASSPSFWTMTSYNFYGGTHPPEFAHIVKPENGVRFTDFKNSGSNKFAWCVRGGAGYDGGHG
jgi:hypothetical protein